MDGDQNPVVSSTAPGKKFFMIFRFYSSSPEKKEKSEELAKRIVKEMCTELKVKCKFEYK
jgi:hypothetical protein